MQDYPFFLAFAALCLLIVGMFKPGWVLPGVNQHRRIKVFCVYAFAFAFALTLVPTEPSAPSTLAPAKKQPTASGDLNSGSATNVNKAFTDCLYAASTLSPILWARAISATSRG